MKAAENAPDLAQIAPGPWLTGRPKKTCVIDVGGGLRDIYGAGVFDTLMDQAITFDFGIGISAGAANLSSFLAGQKGRNLVYYRDYSQRPEYMSVQNVFRKKGFLDLDYIYTTLSNTDGEYPLDFPAIDANPMDFVTVTTNAVTGRPAYWRKNRYRQDDYELIKCSCALPFACHPHKVMGMEYFDGGIADPIPLEKALELGAEKIVLILTRPRDMRRTDKKDRMYAKALRPKYPKVAAALEQRARAYNQALEKALELEEQGKVLILAPVSDQGLKTLTRDPDRLQAMYDNGLQDGFLVREFLEN